MAIVQEFMRKTNSETSLDRSILTIYDRSWSVFTNTLICAIHTVEGTWTALSNELHTAK